MHYLHVHGDVLCTLSFLIMGNVMAFAVQRQNGEFSFHQAISDAPDADFIPQLEHFLQMQEVKISEIQKVVTLSEHGSLTTLRMMNAVMQGLCFNTSRQAVFCNTLHLMQYAAKQETDFFLICVDPQGPYVHTLDHTCMRVQHWPIAHFSQHLLTWIQTHQNAYDQFNKKIHIYVDIEKRLKGHCFPEISVHSALTHAAKWAKYLCDPLFHSVINTEKCA